MSGGLKRELPVLPPATQDLPTYSVNDSRGVDGQTFKADQTTPKKKAVSDELLSK